MTDRPHFLAIVPAVLRRLALAASIGAAYAAPTPKTPDVLTRVEAALETGEIHLADSLFSLPAKSGNDPTIRHRREILFARLAACRGDWPGAEARLRHWEASPTRRTGSGEILFWRGWAALHQARASEADSLFVLASAYTDESRAQEALEYRFATLLENSTLLQDYLRGLPESPLPSSLRAASLNLVSSESRLYPSAQWHLALIYESRGDTARSLEILTKLAKDPAGLPGRRAAAILAFLKEKSNPGAALKEQESILVRNQQGVIAEFSRRRVEGLRKALSGTP